MKYLQMRWNCESVGRLFFVFKTDKQIKWIASEHAVWMIRNEMIRVYLEVLLFETTNTVQIQIWQEIIDWKKLSQMFRHHLKIV